MQKIGQNVSETRAAPPHTDRLIFDYRFYRATSYLGVVAASFLLGVFWQQQRTVPAPPAVAAVTAPAAPAEGNTRVLGDGPSPSAEHTATLRAMPESAPSITGTGPSLVSVSVKADFHPRSALLLGANELVLYHPKAFQGIVRALHDRVPIFALVNNDEEADVARDLMAEVNVRYDAVRILQYPLDSMWLRDYGPIFSRWSDGRVFVVDSVYSADIVHDRTRDDNFNVFIARTLRIPLSRMPLMLEGGNIMFNGDGLLVTTTRIMSREENSHLDPRGIGEILNKHLGCRTWTYVRELEGEPTGHVDMFLLFLRRNTVVVGQYDPAYDPQNAAILDEAAALLANQTTSMGPMVVSRIPMPPRSPEGHWRSYCNVLLVNGVILMPSFADVDPAIEQKAEDVYKELMPNWSVVRVPSDSLAKNRGLLHCVAIGLPGNIDIQPLIDYSQSGTQGY